MFCRLRGHRMKWDAEFNHNQGKGITGICRCGCAVQVLENPHPNEIEVGGEAVALHCTADKMRDAKGNLTPYALACGYIEQVESPGHTVTSGKTVTLWREGACYHVRLHDFSKHERIFWESFPLSELRKARSLFKKTAKNIVAR